MYTGGYFYYQGINRRTAGMGYTFQAIPYIKSRSHRQNVAGAVLERWKKFITARNRSPPLNRSWAPLRHRRIRSATADGPSYRSESFELHKILRAVRSGQFSAPAKFTYAPTTPSQSLAPLDESSRTLGQRRNLERWTTAASPALPGRWSNVAQTLVERL